MSTTALSPVHFLLVDDLEENLLALESLLKRPDLVLLRARSGTEALELLLKHEVALALIDVQMPVMDGFELAELMRGMERTRRVPIIFLTAGSSDWQRRFRGYEAGAVDFLQKPIETDALRSKADVFFELFRQCQEVSRQRDDLRLAADRISQLLQEAQRHAAALQEADQRKDEFLAMLAHELRNPLAPIRTAVEVLKLLPVQAPDVQSSHEIISRQVAHMTRLVDDLLDVARIARGKIELQRSTCDLGQIARRTAEDFRQTLQSKQLELIIQICDRPLIIDGDSVRLAQIIGNLLHNAGKFTPAGGTITVTAAADLDEKNAILSVQDSGLGMESELLSRLFEPFFQANQTFDRKLGGLGLGLALAKGIVDLHQGEIFASSPGPGKGATFSIRVPLSQRVAQDPEAAPHPPEHPQTQISVVVVEDNPDAAKSLQRLIKLLGHEASAAFDGASGLVQIQRQLPDVVISDLGLPGQMSGFELARQVRCERSLDRIVLVALSGYGQEDDRREALSAGFDHFLVKPVDLPTLKSVLMKKPSSLGLMKFGFPDQ